MYHTITLSRANPVSKLKNATGTDIRKERKKSNLTTRLLVTEEDFSPSSLNVSLNSNSPVIITKTLTIGPGKVLLRASS